MWSNLAPIAAARPERSPKIAELNPHLQVQIRSGFSRSEIPRLKRFAAARLPDRPAALTSGRDTACAIL
jgi:hypothetical protein